MARELTFKQQRFIAEYLLDGIGSAAYQRAGYAGKGNIAEVEAYKLLRNPKIHAALATRRHALAEKVELKQEEVVREMKLLALSSLAHYRIDAQGNVTVAPGVPPEAMRAVSSIKRRVIHRETDKEKMVTYHTELKLWDKPSMIQTAGRYLRLFDDKDPATTRNNNYLILLNRLAELAASKNVEAEERKKIEEELKGLR